MTSKNILAPASAEYLVKLFTAVFTPCRIGQSVNIITFSGAGKWANLNFLSDYATEFDPTYPSTAYIFFDAQHLAFSVEEELRNGISFMYARALAQKNEELVNIAKESATSNSLFEFMNTVKLINEIGQRVIIFIDNADFLAQKNRKSQLAIATLTTLEQMHTARVSFVFITKSEISKDLIQLGRLGKYFTQNVVTESDVPHDEACVTAYIQRFEITRGVNFSKNAKINLSTFAKGMPIISKHFIEMYNSNQIFKKLIDSSSPDIASIYATDALYLDTYFEQLLYRLSPASMDFLFGITMEPTRYLYNAGLINSQNSPINETFTYYLTNRGNRYSVTKGFDSLTSQELRVYQLLIDFLGKTVTREEVARALWLEEWQSRYSEQSIDKVISNIRAKLSTSEYKISSIKGVGVLAEKN